MDVKNIWFISFESKGIYKVGGLGEVAGSITQALAEKDLNVALVMPSHGVVKDEKLRKSLQLEKVGFVRTYAYGIEYLISVYEGKLGKVKVYLISGGNENAEKILENPVVYADGITEPKAALLARTLDFLYDFSEWIPDIVHINDWHAVPAGIAIRQHTEAKESPMPLLFQIHLYGGKYVSLNYLREFCGINPEFEMNIWLEGEQREYTFKEIYDMSGGILERIAAYISDVVATVSESYLKKDEGNVLQCIGWHFEDKSTFIYNGCDWFYDKIIANILEKHGEKIREFIGIEDLSQLTRRHLRKYLLEKALGELPESEPIIKDDYLADIVKRLRGPIVNEDGKTLAFGEEGPLVIITGRTSTQKGLDTLIRSIPAVLDYYPNAKFLFLLLPVRGGERLIEEIFAEACKYSNSVRIVYGIVPYIYFLAHVAATVYAAPSRWEPFGIMALESMAVGTPVAASRVGGLSETILDLREHGLNGTGLLVPKDNPEELAKAITSLISLMETENVDELRVLKEKIQYPELKNLLSRDVGRKIRESCLKRIEDFRWIKIADMAIKVYNIAINRRKRCKQ